jgi:hypothetical protein
VFRTKRQTGESIELLKLEVKPREERKGKKLKDSLKFAKMLRDLASQECYEEDIRHSNRKNKKAMEMALRSQRKEKDARLNPVEEEESF